MKVKVTMMLRGRENAHPEYGNKMMQKIIEDVESCGRPEVTTSSYKGCAHHNPLF